MYYNYLTLFQIKPKDFKNYSKSRRTQLSFSTSIQEWDLMDLRASGAFHASMTNRSRGSLSGLEMYPLTSSLRPHSSTSLTSLKRQVQPKWSQSNPEITLKKVYLDIIQQILLYRTILKTLQSTRCAQSQQTWYARTHGRKQT